MSKVLYEANPSMLRMNPLGTLLAILILLAGIALAVASGMVTALLGLPAEASKVAGLVGIVVAALAFLRLLSWYVATKTDQLTIKEDELVWTHGLLSKDYTEISMGSVRTTRVTQTVMQRIMGAGDVAIYTSGDLPELVIRGLPEPDRIRDLIKGDAARE
jgi:uncharacterized membrane protein YdbT with pleckstrin-like domain